MTDIDTAAEREAIRAALAPGIAEIQACVYADEGSCGGCQKDLDVIAPLVESLIDARVRAAKAEARREEREAWSGWLDSWVSAAQVDPPTVEAIANWLRAEQPPFGKSAGGAS